MGSASALPAVGTWPRLWRARVSLYPADTLDSVPTCTGLCWGRREKTDSQGHRLLRGHCTTASRAGTLGRRELVLLPGVRRGLEGSGEIPPPEAGVGLPCSQLTLYWQAYLLGQWPTEGKPHISEEGPCGLPGRPAPTFTRCCCPQVRLGSFMDSLRNLECSTGTCLQGAWKSIGTLQEFNQLKVTFSPRPHTLIPLSVSPLKLYLDMACERFCNVIK